MKNRKKLVSILAGIMAAIMILSFILSVIPSASAASSSEIQKQINAMKQTRAELRQRMEEIESNIETNDNEILEMVSQKNVIDQEIGILYAEIVNINEQISAYNLLIADQQEQLEEAEANYDTLSELYKDRIRAMEEEGEVSYWAVLFKANSFSDLLDRLNMVEEIAAADQRRLDELRTAAEAVQTAKAELQLQKDDLEVTRSELAETEEEMEAKREEAVQIIQDLVEQGADFEALLAEAEDEEDYLTGELSELEKEYKAAKASEEAAYWAAYWATYVPPTEESTQPTTQSTTAASGTTGSAGETETEATTEPTEAPTEATTPPASSERWIIPCSYVMITSPFGEREAPTAGASSYHLGIDLAGPEGTPIKASRSGTVYSATYGNSGGYQVIIDHGDGFKSYYLHMTHYIVSKGQKVSQGQVIGYMGSTGISTGNHLHFGIRTKDGYVNPAAYVAFY